MHAVPSTTEVAASRTLGRYVDERWVDWAISMVEAGTTTPSICSLAAASAPFNAFEMPELVDSALGEVGAKTISSKVQAARIIASIRSGQVLEGKVPVDHALAEIARLCIDHDYLPDLYDFYLLHWANEDLKVSDCQWYWPSATRENIKNVLMEHLKKWTAENPLEA